MVRVYVVPKRTIEAERLEKYIGMHLPVNLSDTAVKILRGRNGHKLEEKSQYYFEYKTLTPQDPLAEQQTPMLNSTYKMQILREVIAHLSPTRRRDFIRHYIREEKYRRVAEKRHVTLGAVRMSLEEARHEVERKFYASVAECLYSNL